VPRGWQMIAGNHCRSVNVQEMRDILGFSGSFVIGLAALMFQPFTFLWCFALAIGGGIFLFCAAHIIFAYTSSRFSRAFQSLLRRRIPIEDAARIAYERAERANPLYLIDLPTMEPQAKLDHFKRAFMRDDEVTLYGIKPPSAALTPIPREELSELYPVSGLSQLNYITPFQQLAYTGVEISQKDLRRTIGQYIPRVRQAMRQFKGS
jgi:hypothetical protein